MSEGDNQTFSSNPTTDQPLTPDLSQLLTDLRADIAAEEQNNPEQNNPPDFISFSPSQTMSTEEEFTVGGLTSKINPTEPVENATTIIGVLFTKEHRPDVGSKEEIELIKSINTNQYEKYKLMNTSIKDPESLKTNLSLQD